MCVLLSFCPAGVWRTHFALVQRDVRLRAPEYERPEEYEEKCPSMKSFFKGVGGNVLFVVSGAGKVSGATLRILENLQNCNIHILYIKPDSTFLSKTASLQENLVFNVLQQYARSAVIKKLYIVDNQVIESMLDEIPVLEYYDKLNELISSTIHMINVFDRSDPVYETPVEDIETARISTFGLVDTATGEEQFFFSLDNARKKRYIYAISHKQLETDGTLFRTITDQTKEKSQDGSVKVNLEIHSTQYEQNYGYVIADATTIQE